MKETMKNHDRQDLKYSLFGWILFIVCAIFFIASSLKNGDTLTFIGSLIFLIACIVFLIPLIKTTKKNIE
jgi:predicted membrane channel-forming protein YqfA (hemolysin III family)